MVDKNLYFINDTGNIVESINNSQIKHAKSQGEELTNILSTSPAPAPEYSIWNGGNY